MTKEEFNAKIGIAMKQMSSNWRKDKKSLIPLKQSLE